MILVMYITFFHFSVLYIKITHATCIHSITSTIFIHILAQILDQFETLFQTFLFRGDEYNHRGLDICPCTSARHRFVVAHFWITHQLGSWVHYPKENPQHPL